MRENLWDHFVRERQLVLDKTSVADLPETVREGVPRRLEGHASSWAVSKALDEMKRLATVALNEGEMGEAHTCLGLWIAMNTHIVEIVTKTVDEAREAMKQKEAK